MPVKFYLESRPNKANEHPIRVSICVKSVKYISTIGYSVDAANWQSERVTGGKYTNKKNKSRIEINNAISKIESHFERYERDLDTKPTVAQLKEQLNIALGKSEEPEETQEKPKTRNVFDDFSEFVQEQSAACQWAYAILQCWKTFRNHLTAHNPKIKYEDFNEEGLNKFIAFLRTTQNLEEKTAQKTNDRLPIDLSRNAKAILEKYKDEQFPFGLAPPVISNQKMNHYLKDLGELCGFTTPITIVCYRAGQRVEKTYPKYSLIGTHAARRTFICFALSNGVPPQVVMKWTCHSDYKAMRPYIDIAEKTKADAMKLIDNAWGM